MNHGSQQGFAHLVVPKAGAEGTAEESLVPAERTLGLPPLAVHPLRAAPRWPGLEPADHLPAVAAPDRTAAPTPAVHREHTRADAKVASGVGVVVFAVERRVSEQGVDLDPSSGRSDSRAELARIVPGTAGDNGRQEQMGAGVGDRRELRPPRSPDLLPRPQVVVPAGVAGLQAGGIDRRVGVLEDQSAGGRNSYCEELVSPFFPRSRSAAFWRVE